MGNSALTPGLVAVDTGGGVDEKVKASAGDATAGFLDAKVDGVTITVSANTLSTVDGGIDHDALLNTHNLTTDIDHDALTNFVANEHINHTSVTLTAGAGLSGGGDISANRTFNVDINSEVDTVITPTDEILFGDVSDSNNIKKDTVQGILDLVAGGSAIEVFSTSGTWTCPVGVNYIQVSLFGGGGGGGGGRTNSPHNSGTGGGGGAAILNHLLRVTPSSTYAVTVGAGGAGGTGGAAAGNPGSAGGNSSMVGDDFTLTANGGGGGFGGQSSDADVVGAGGAANIDDQVITSIKTIMNAPGPNATSAPTTYVPISWPGGDGGDSATDSSRDGGAGGNSMFGQGGTGGDYSGGVPPTAGNGIGAGGGGGRGQGNPGLDGAAGSQGLVIIWYSQNGAPS